MNRELPVRKSIRLGGYDYARSGRYFVTICVRDRHEILWDLHLRPTPLSVEPPVGAHTVRPFVADSSIYCPEHPPLSITGETVETAIHNISCAYDAVNVDIYTVMPNHVHMILALQEDHGRTLCAPTVSRIVKQFKGFVTKHLGYPIWQKSFHDHIIRNQDEYETIWRYIEQNPQNWKEDCYY